MLRDKIKSLCRDRGITVCALEDQAGLAHGTIKKWNENRVQNPRVSSILAVARVLGVTTEELMEESDERTSQDVQE